MAGAINRSRDKDLMKIVEVRLVQSKIFQMPTICALPPEDLYTLYLKRIKDNQVILFNLNRNCLLILKYILFCLPTNGRLQIPLCLIVGGEECFENSHRKSFAIQAGLAFFQAKEGRFKSYFRPQVPFGHREAEHMC